MRLIEVTFDYPYGSGETFCENELKIAEKLFDEIIIVTMTGRVSSNDIRYIPDNSKVICARRTRYEAGIIVLSLIKLLRIKTFREFIFAKKQLKVKDSFTQIIITLFYTYYYEYLLKRALNGLDLKRDDILYSYWLSGTAYAVLSVKADSYKVSRAHGFDCFIERGYQPFRRELLNGFDAIYSISEAGKESIEKNLCKYVDYDGKKVRVSRLGVINTGVPCFEKKNNQALMVVTCSNINSIKRLDIMIDSLAIANFPVKWVHIGDGELEKEIKNKAESIKANSNVHIEFMGRMRNEEIYSYYSNHYIDVFVNCSDSEGIPVSIMEAMSFGIPVIARNVGGNAEIVNSGCGFLLNKEISPRDLVLTIKKVYELDDKEIYILRKGAYDMFRERFDANKNYVEFFEDVCGGGMSLRWHGDARRKSIH